MILFFLPPSNKIYAVQATHLLTDQDIEKLNWLFGNSTFSDQEQINGAFVGPRKEMVTPWSTNAVEITQNMGIEGIERIEEFYQKEFLSSAYDPMLQRVYENLDQHIFDINVTPEPVKEIDDISAYNEKEGLALSEEEIEYLNSVSNELGRKLTDSEVFGFSQVNSEHCRHKIFNGTFIINGEEKQESLFQLIKKTSRQNPNYIVSAYKDNVAFVQGPDMEQFAPVKQDKPDFFQIKKISSVISLKAETHNFPTTVEPFNGAATGTGGEIRDRLAGGQGSIPLAGTAVYMTSYPRLGEGRQWENNVPERKWLYQSPLDILIKASDGASDFGNKFGQPLICGSVLTFEHQENEQTYGFDKVIMLAGGVGFGNASHSKKGHPEKGDRIIVMGGDNYRIGMGGSAVSSVATGEFSSNVELNAIQRSNPEMQKRVMNAIRAMVEADENPIISIHDHGAGGHLNCLSELVEESGGNIKIEKLPVGDPTLSEKEIIGNESQERMGLVIKPKDLEVLQKVAERERAPLYNVGDVTGDHKLIFASKENKKDPIHWDLSHMFGSSPKTILEDKAEKTQFKPVQYDQDKMEEYLHQLLQLESVACKDWLTNKVDRSVTGKVAMQQTCGKIQLPLNNVAVMALDYTGKNGTATSIGHAPVAMLIDEAGGAKLSIVEALTNLVWAPLSHGLKGVSLSANWMWPAKNEGENARLYNAVEAVSEFSIALGINIPTGKDSLSMTQKYPDGKKVISPGTVIISTVAQTDDVNKAVSTALAEEAESQIIYIDFANSHSYELGGSAFAQVMGGIENEIPAIPDAQYVKAVFNAIQHLIKENYILAGHDVASGGLITTLLEMLFPSPEYGIRLNLSDIPQEDIVKLLFSEQNGVVIQVNDIDKVTEILEQYQVNYYPVGLVTEKPELEIQHREKQYSFDVHYLRDKWFKTSYLMDRKQRPEEQARKRFDNYKYQPLQYKFPNLFDGKLNTSRNSNIKGAIIREKGVNGDREMAYAMYLAGMDVKDVHMTDLISGREDLSDVQFIAFVGGFSNSDVLGSAKGWAGAFLYNERAKKSLDAFYARKDTLSLGVCNGCQLMMELGLIYPDKKDHPKMHHNSSGKFESAFINVDIGENNAVMLKNFEDSRLGVWLAHGEGRFILPEPEDNYNIVARYSHFEYPGNPNGSGYSTAAVASMDGRHLAIMPHIERSLFPWNWPYYPKQRKDLISPWVEAFINAKKWLEKK
ncbi:MAG: phosphoribosylformylglycinamidine synthase [Candidatus Cyclobacteriaceae bacterium M2_1C_046]